MATPVRYPCGVTNVGPGNPLNKFPMPSPLEAHVYFNDFDHYTVTSNWTATISSSTATHALTDADGGVLLLTPSAEDDGNVFIQKVGESFKVVTGYQTWFAARVKVSDATQSDFLVGLQITDTSPLDATDGIYFKKDDGDAYLDLVVVQDSTATTTAAIATVVSDTYIDVAWHFNGVDNIDYYVDGVKIGHSATTYLPDDEELTISFGVQNGQTASKTFYVDYVFAAKER